MPLSKLQKHLEKAEEGCSWSLTDSRRAKSLLKERFSGAPFTPETIQEMINSLIADFGDDPGEIERVITAHFTKRIQ